ncbi:DedA family protein [Candidatus Bathyarchaeota archaeon]|nr:DedA family protein [Candidatus Bathyarchaeota archaeon]
MRRVSQLYWAASTLLLVLISIQIFTSTEPPSLGITRNLFLVAVGFVEELGYLGVFISMTLESALIPIPSEIVVPLAGYLSYEGIFNFWLIVFTATVANLLGSLILYLLGARYGRGLLHRYGWLLHIREGDLERAERWIARYGTSFILLGRMTPALRTVISLPAGIGRMDVGVFSILTLIGSLPWNLTLAYTGFILGQNWIIVEELLGKVDLIVAAALILLLIYFLWIRRSSELS